MAWIRALVLIAAVALLASCGGGSSAKVVDPLAGDGSLEAGGDALGNMGRDGVHVHFIETSLFGIGLVFHNTTRRSVTVVDARVAPPLQSIVRQVGVTLESWNPRPCPPHVMGCLVSPFFRTPSASARAGPVVVKPEKGIAVQLDFLVGRCSDVPLASFAAVNRVDIAYRADGGLEHQTVDLGRATLRLQRPPATVCRQRPFSRLAVDGIFAGSTASTIPSARLQRRRAVSRRARDRGEDRRRHRRPRLDDLSRLPRIRHRRPADSRDARGHVQATLTGFRKQPFHAFGTWACTLGS
jgi:hypothetical protein